MEIYTITTTGDNGTRCVGYFKDLDMAIRCVEDNAYDIAECGYYKYAIIEQAREGIYQYDLEPLFFEFDRNNNIYKRIETPKKFKGYCGFWH